jgi:alpha-2-macroglobulin
LKRLLRGLSIFVWTWRGEKLLIIHTLIQIAVEIAGLVYILWHINIIPKQFITYSEYSILNFPVTDSTERGSTMKKRFRAILEKVKSLSLSVYPKVRECVKLIILRITSSRKNKIVASVGGLSFVFVIIGIVMLSGQDTDIARIDKTMYGAVEEVDDSVLRVIQASPSGALEGKDRKKEVTVVFNHPMTALSDLSNKETGIFDIVPNVKGNYRWYGSRICAFIPETGWEYGKTYKITIKKGSVSLNSKTLPENFQFSFSFDMPSLDVNGGTIQYRDRTIDYDQSFYLDFSSPVRIQDVRSSVILESKGRTYPYLVEYTTNRNYSEDEEGDENPRQQEITRKRVAITPSGRFDFDSKVDLKVKAGLLSEGKDSEVKDDKIFSYTTHGALTVTLEQKDGFFEDIWRTNIVFSNEVSFATLKKAVILSPSAPWRESEKGKTRYLSVSAFTLKPGGTYKITVNPLSDIHGNWINKKETFELKVPDMKPDFFLENSYNNILESAASPTIPVRVSSLPEIDVELANFDVDDVASALVSNDYDVNNKLSKSLSKNYSFKWKTGFNNNQGGRVGLDLGKYLSADRTGWLGVWICGNEINYKGVSEYVRKPQIVQATNLGLSVKESYDSSDIWVHSLNTGQAVSNATVKFYDGKSLINSAVTNESGFCHIVNKSGDPYKNSLYVVTKGKNDKAFVSAKQHQFQMYNVSNNYNRDGYKPLLMGQIIFDRKLYRPGDLVNYKAILIHREKGKVLPIKESKLDVIVENPKGEKVSTESIRTSEQGGLWGSYKIPDGAPLGHYQIRIEESKNSYVNDTFQTEEFKPVSFSTIVTGLADSKVGANLKVTVLGRYLFGAPMKDAPVSYSMLRMKKRISFEKYSGFTFGDGQLWETDEVDWSGAGYFTGANGTLNSEGKYTFNLKPQAMNLVETITEPSQTINLSDVYDLKLEAKVKDVDTKSVTKSEFARIFPSDFLPGIKAKNRYQNQSTPFVFDLVAVGNNGKSAGPRSAVVYVVKYDYKSIFSKAPGGTLQPRNTLVKKIVYRSDVVLSDTPQPLSVSVPESGNYVIIVQEKGGLAYSRESFYAWGSEFSGWQMDDDDSITIVPDKKDYQPGETAHVLIQSPFKKCKAIISIERETVLWQTTIDIDGSGSPIDIPMKQEYLPNVYLSVMLIRPRISVPTGADAIVKKVFIDNDLGAPKFKAGIVKLSVSNASKKAKLVLTTDKETYSPGDEMSISINSEPNAEVAISVADRGVLDLIDYRYVDPVNKFYQNWYLAVKILENRRYIIKQYRDTQKGESPGGQGKGDDLEGLGGFDKDGEDGARKDIRYTAYWNPKIMTNKEGKATVTFKLPHNLTTFRIMSLVSSDGRYNSCEKEIMVKKSLVIQKNLPRFMRPGDNLSMGAVVTNQTNISGRFNFVLSSNLISPKKLTTTVDIAAGESRELVFPISLDLATYLTLKKSLADNYLKDGKSQQAEVKGTLDISPVNISSFTSAGFKQSDVTDKLEFSFPVKESKYEEAFTISGFTNSTENEFLRIPEPGKILSNMGSFDLSLSSSALTGLGKGFSFYNSNPYYCLEQRASAFLLGMTSGKLLSQFSINPASAMAYDFSKIENLFLGQINDFQNADGGFRLWKDSKDGESNPYVTAYALFVMQTAANKGYSVNSSVLEKASQYIINYTKKPPKDSYLYVYETFALINYTLALSNNYNTSLGTFLYDNRKELSSRSLAYLAMALAIHEGVTDYKKNSHIKNIYEQLMNDMVVTTRKVSFREKKGDRSRTFNTNGSTAATIMRMMMMLDRNNPLIPSVVQYIIADASVWNDSHGSGIAALALHDYYGLYEKNGSGSSFDGIVSFNGKPFFSTNLKKDILVPANYSLPIDKLSSLGTSGTNLPLVISSTGNNRMYYTASLSYYPSLQTIEPKDEGIEIRKEIESVDNASGKFATFGVGKASLTRGNVYKVTIRVVVSKPAFNILISDPIPSNVEIINTDFKTESSVYAKLTTKNQTQNDFWWRNSSPNIEYRDDSVLVTQDYMEPGLHEFVYLIRPVLKGNSSSPAATSKLMYEPEIFGRTYGGVLTVK